jgi:hypothetical protein
MTLKYWTKQRKREIRTCFDNFYEECEQQNELLRDEIIKYLCVKTLNTEHILYFWKNNAIKYSKLAKVEKIVLSVSVTQFESQRNFSSSGRTLDDRRLHVYHLKTLINNFLSKVILKIVIVNKIKFCSFENLK